MTSSQTLHYNVSSKIKSHQLRLIPPEHKSSNSSLYSRSIERFRAQHALIAIYALTKRRTRRDFTTTQSERRCTTGKTKIAMDLNTKSTETLERTNPTYPRSSSLKKKLKNRRHPSNQRKLDPRKIPRVKPLSHLLRLTTRANQPHKSSKHQQQPTTKRKTTDHTTRLGHEWKNRARKARTRSAEKRQEAHRHKKNAAPFHRHCRRTLEQNRSLIDHPHAAHFILSYYRAPTIIILGKVGDDTHLGYPSIRNHNVNPISDGYDSQFRVSIQELRLMPWLTRTCPGPALVGGSLRSLCSHLVGRERGKWISKYHKCS